ncbi:hypothetical protein OIV83_000421 [Microbotryomycetes sp. JL201]|nr:hypothetical protein OIV83_000421 [Microbotryomycetes sp. JL201]
MSPPRTGSAGDLPLLPATATEPTPPKTPEVEHSSTTASSSTSSPPAHNLISPLPPLPIEVFILILTFLETNSKLSLRLVSRAWNSFMTAEASLWSELIIKVPSTTEEFLRVRTQLAHVTKTKKPRGGGIKELVLVLQGARHPQDRHGRVFDKVPWRDAEQQLRIIYDTLFATSVQKPPDYSVDKQGECESTITKLEMYCQPNTPASWRWISSVNVFWIMFRNVSHIKLHANLSGVSIDGSLLSLWPKANTVELLFVAHQEQHWHVPPSSKALGCIDEDMAPPEADSLDQLERIFLQHLVVLPDLHLPALPKLRKLHLYDCSWTGMSFFNLLRLCRRTLQDLRLVNFELNEAGPDEEEAVTDYEENIYCQEPTLYDHACDIPSLSCWDAPLAPIVMRKLKTLLVDGETAPGFWANRDNTGRKEVYTRPCVKMPALLDAELRELSVEPDEPDAELTSVGMLGKLAPKVQHLDLVNTNTGDASLHRCLFDMQGPVTHLDLHGTDVSDRLIIHLDTLAPHLRRLSVTSCDCITIQTVARLLERYREYNDHRLQWVSVDPPSQQSSWDDWRAWLWLDFHDVLHRSDLDPAGPGPCDVHDRQRWKSYGKSSDESKHSKAWRDELEERANLRSMQWTSSDSSNRESSSVPGRASASHPGQSALSAFRQWRSSFDSAEFAQRYDQM